MRPSAELSRGSRPAARRPFVPGAWIAATVALGAWLAPAAPAADGTAPVSAETPAAHTGHGSASGGAGARWRGTRITYSDASRLPRTVREAVRLWNRATTSVRLVRAPAGRRGQIHITGANPCGRPCAHYPPDGRVFLPTRGPGVDRPEDDLTLSLVVHELGHALGLPHRSGCSVMTTYVGFSECPPLRRPFSYRCGPQRADAVAIARMYGGRARIDGLCRHPAPRPARAVVLAPRAIVPAADPDFAHAVTVRVRNTSAVAWESGLNHTPQLRFTDARGRLRPHCGAAGVSLLEQRVARRGVASFRVQVCPTGAPPATVTVFLRLTLETLGGVSRGPVFPVRVAFPPRPPDPAPQPLPDPAPEVRFEPV